MNTFTNNKIQWTKIKHDTNGNPRYVCHFLNLLTDNEKNLVPEYLFGTRYNIAIQRANKIGGRKFHNKQYGGGIVFQSYNLADTERAIFDLIAKES